MVACDHVTPSEHPVRDSSHVRGLATPGSHLRNGVAVSVKPTNPPGELAGGERHAIADVQLSVEECSRDYGARAADGEASIDPEPGKVVVFGWSGTLEDTIERLHERADPAAGQRVDGYDGRVRQLGALELNVRPAPAPLRAPRYPVRPPS